MVGPRIGERGVHGRAADLDGGRVSMRWRSTARFGGRNCFLAWTRNRYPTWGADACRAARGKDQGAGRAGFLDAGIWGVRGRRVRTFSGGTEPLSGVNLRGTGDAKGSTSRRAMPLGSDGGARLAGASAPSVSASCLGLIFIGPNQTSSPHAISHTSGLRNKKRVDVSTVECKIDGEKRRKLLKSDRVVAISQPIQTSGAVLGGLRNRSRLLIESAARRG
jgi:hypothetical protein